MFGIFRSKKDSVSKNAVDPQKAFEIALQILDIFETMRAEAPGAAHVFASTVHRTGELIDHPALPLDRKILLIERNIIEAIPDKGADAGVSLLALRFIRVFLIAAKNPNSGSMMLRAAYADIAKHGKYYRDLQARDYRAPKDESANRILASQGLSCIADMVSSVRRAGEEIKQPRESMDEDIQNLLAAFDLREEASTGGLSHHVEAMQVALSRA